MTKRHFNYVSKSKSAHIIWGTSIKLLKLIRQNGFFNTWYSFNSLHFSTSIL